MKVISKCLLYTLGLMVVPQAFSAAEGKENPAADYKLPIYKIEEIAALPKPIHKPFPPIWRGLAGNTIKLKFTVDEKGRPGKVRVVRQKGIFPTDEVRDFAVGVRIMVSNWKFSPALDANNQPVAVKVIMPVQVIDKEDRPVALATLQLDQDKDEKI